MSEKELNLENCRKIHMTTINNKPVFYVEWKHKNEGTKTIPSLIKSYSLENNWNKFIIPGTTVIDIGAHTGDTMIPAALLCSTILCVEPNPFVREILEINCELNKHLCNIIVAEELVTNVDTDSIVLYDHDNDMCNGGILDKTLSEHTQNIINQCAKNSVVCKGLTLESMCKKYLTDVETSNISFIKIDTEGHDKEIIRSSKDFLNKYKPNLFIEWFAFYGDEDNIDLFKVIEDINYVAFNPTNLEKASINHRIWDLILIHKDKINGNIMFENVIFR